MSEINVLDREEEIKEIDKSGMLKICMRIPEDCAEAIKRAKGIKIPGEVKISESISIRYKQPQHVLIAGMGGSAIGGEILRDWLLDQVPLPIEVCRDYTLPNYADQNTLVFVISYSGKTEETLRALVDAIRRGCMVMAITSGGYLLSISKKLRIPCLKILGGMPPRAAIPYLFFPLPVLMKKMGLPLEIEEDISETAENLRKLRKETAPQTITENNPSKKLALELVDTIPIVYGFGPYGAVAHRWKTQFNENSKVPSYWEVFPELNHNEVMGWEAPETLTRKFSVILLRDQDEQPEIRRKIEVTKELALCKAQRVLEIYAVGRCKLAKIFSLLHIGDMTSVYLAILRRVDPTPVGTIERIKERIGEKFDITQSLKEEIGGITGKGLTLT
ncbi:MAG: bifunctional phosphoglucose/phosphomannose isomerase [Candidatus Bathyarchaeia archaeon]